MTREEFEYLKTEEARQLIEEYIYCDSSKVAFKIRNPTIATQIKNLQKCRIKLPAYYKARCIIPTLSYEQSSSEATAFSKNEEGNVAIDLTCGLGVDTFYLSKRFEKVVAVEIDSLLADIARYNFEKLGATNVGVICSSAEDYVELCPEVDLIYIDPSRRNDAGRSVHAVEQCKPNVLAMLPLLNNKSKKIIIKLSPLFDVNESFRLFGQNATCQVVTVNNECKEVLIYISDFNSHALELVIIREDNRSLYKFAENEIVDIYSTPEIMPKYLLVPDVAFYKSRTVSALMKDVEHYYSGGYVLTEVMPKVFCGNVYEISEILAYKPKTIKKIFKKAIVHIRNFPYTIEQIGIQQGGNQHLFFTNFRGENTVFIVK